MPNTTGPCGDNVRRSEPRGNGERSLSLLAAAGIETVGIPDADHWPFLDRPQLFVEALVKLLAGLQTSAAT